MRRSRAQPEKSIRSFQNSVPLLLTVGKTVVSVSTSNFHRLLSPVIYAEPAVWILLPLIFHFIYNNQTRTHCLLSFIRKTGRDYPCLCLCFGFSQITLILPFLLMILHFSQMGFTDDLTFIVKILLSHLPSPRLLKTFWVRKASKARKTRHFLFPVSQESVKKQAQKPLRDHAFNIIAPNIWKCKRFFRFPHSQFHSSI